MNHNKLNYILSSEAYQYAHLNQNYDLLDLLLGNFNKFNNSKIINEWLFIACCSNNLIDIVKILINIPNNCINYNIINSWIFEYVCLKNDIETVKLLLSIKNSNNIDYKLLDEPIFISACCDGNSNFIYEFLNYNNMIL